jgi:hypothetical protein
MLVYQRVLLVIQLCPTDSVDSDVKIIMKIVELPLVELLMIVSGLLQCEAPKI